MTPDLILNSPPDSHAYIQGKMKGEPSNKSEVTQDFLPATLSILK